MPSYVVPLPGPLVLVPTKSLDLKIRQQLRDHPRLPASLQQLAADLNQRAEGVPATFDRPRGGSGQWSVLLYGETYVARLFLSGRQDAYTIGAIHPLRIRDHHRIAQGCLMVRPTGWHLIFEHRQIPPNSTSHYPALSQAWQRLDASHAERRGAPARSEQQTRFLDTVDRLIDATERITQKAADSTRPFPYRSVAATGGERHGTRSIYEFRLAAGADDRDAAPEEGAFVQVRGEPEQRGQVTRVAGATVTIRFDDPVDWEAIPRQGELEVTFSSVVYAKQREAVKLLRSRQEHGPRLLPALVEHQVRPIRPAPDAPSEPLDPESGQLDAFRKALAVEDMLLILGPPGTGKTRTISQIAGGAARRAGTGPVLITSHTNRAVDNVLPRLPSGLWTVRVGNDGRVTEEGRPYLLETQATELRQTILNGTGPRLDRYDGIDVAGQAAQHLETRLDRLAEFLAAETRARAEFDATRRSAGGAAQQRVTELTAGRQQLAATIESTGKRIARLARRRDTASRRTRWRLIGPLLAFLVRRHDHRLAVAREQVMGLHDDDARLRAELDAAERHLEAIIREHPAVRQARETVARAERESAACRAEAFSAARSCRAAVPPADAAVPPPPPVREDADPQTADRDLAGLRSWLGQWLPLLAARRRLLGEWHQAVSGETRQLHPELIRYAHVIAATSVGVASRPELAGVDFDLAIVDEAGQIGIADVLVPLVRARRAVLVGDHQQLPPFLDTEVEAWGRGLNDPAITELLSRSALETMVDALPGTHVVPLTVQRRMPAVIADFASASFYGGKLLTGSDVTRDDHRDPIFRSPMAFVDTARLPERERYEKSGRASEKWGQRGYTNPTEARMLVRLAELYHGRGVEWAVIVPYRAQAALVTAQLTRLIGNPELVGLNVGTVDSFQGGERDVILYGFTRSNPSGGIGFLKELRRLNVALTRAKHQLVLVGDMDTLTGARDTPFRELAVSLRAHLAEHGDIRQYREIHDHLTGRLRDGGAPA